MTAHALLRANEARRLDGEVQLRLSALLCNLGQPPGGERRPPPPPEDPEEGFYAERPEDNARCGPVPGAFRLRRELEDLFLPRVGGEEFCYCIWTRTGAVFGQSANAPAGIPPPPRDTDAVILRSRASLREGFEFTPPGECLLVGVSEAPAQREAALFARWLLAAGTVVLVSGLAGGA